MCVLPPAGGLKELTVQFMAFRTKQSMTITKHDVVKVISLRLVKKTFHKKGGVEFLG